MPPPLTGDLNPNGLNELASHGDGWGAPDVLAALLAIAGPETAQSVSGRAPDFTLTSTDGRQVSLADLSGHPLVINFWATYCPPCRTEMPLLERIVPTGSGINLVLIDEGEQAPAVRAFLSSVGITGPALLDPDLGTGRAYGVLGFPTTVFVRADGTLEGRYVGALDEGVLAAHLGNLTGQ